ncbi:TIGR03899 family protein [Aliidiomarina taiwanensis]|uniref:TIGR03899 family protein n=1 Tax=Aliidiomarina taiwanensis TaxID=946228 RepID=A0A432X1I3_9GAMM|nr:TIGR03899 family protein [Aliidiomarina taiwanensis]RUO40031.1 TIGR03899 family protein [Aliidiomarina taiwanensis]
MHKTHREQYIITPCRSRSRLVQSLEAFGIHIPMHASEQSLSLASRYEQRQHALTLRHQENLERIIQRALDKSDKILSITRPDQDWLEHFLELAERTAHPRMQELWARVLLLESQSPSSFSIRTLRVLALLTPYEASVLRRAKSMTAFEKRTSRHKIIIGYQQKPRFLRAFSKKTAAQANIAKCGLNYPDILALVELGILHADLIETGLLTMRRAMQLSSGSQRISVTPLEKELVLTYFRYTPIGEELCRLIPSTQNEEYWQELEQALEPKFLLQQDTY